MELGLVDIIRNKCIFYVDFLPTVYNMAEKGGGDKWEYTVYIYLLTNLLDSHILYSTVGWVHLIYGEVTTTFYLVRFTCIHTEGWAELIYCA